MFGNPKAKLRDHPRSRPVQASVQTHGGFLLGVGRPVSPLPSFEWKVAASSKSHFEPERGCVVDQPQHVLAELRILRCGRRFTREPRFSNGLSPTLIMPLNPSRNSYRLHLRSEPNLICAVIRRI